MRSRSTRLAVAASLLALTSSAAFAQAVPPDTGTPDIKNMVARLDLEKYKATIKGLTQFGDRRQGTKRNRDAVDWIEAQLKSYGCTNTERITYTYPPPQDTNAARGRGNGGRGAGGAGRGPQGPTGSVIGVGPANNQGGSRSFGVRTRTGVNTDSLAQKDPKLRALNSEPTSPGERQEVYCTKVGTTHPNEMYIVGGHMDGHGWGEAANDDGSGTALAPTSSSDRRFRGRNHRPARRNTRSRSGSAWFSTT